MSEVSIEKQDSPTHRVHLLQMSLKEIEEHTAQVRANRAIFVEKVKKIKANNRIAREAEVDKQLKKLFAKITRTLNSTEEDIAECDDLLNKARALIWETSDGAIDVTKLDTPNGNEVSKAD